jgi:hypothetical protein
MFQCYELKQIRSSTVCLLRLQSKRVAPSLLLHSWYACCSNIEGEPKNPHHEITHKCVHFETSYNVMFKFIITFESLKRRVQWPAQILAKSGVQVALWFVSNEAKHMYKRTVAPLQIAVPQVERCFINCWHDVGLCERCANYYDWRVGRNLARSAQGPFQSNILPPACRHADGTGFIFVINPHSVCSVSKIKKSWQ